MWVTGTWKLWLVPPPNMTDKREFYRRISVLISQGGDALSGIDAGDTEMVLDTHPAIRGMRGVLRSPGLTNISFSGNRMNNFYLPDGIILRSNL